MYHLAAAHHALRSVDVRCSRGSLASAPCVRCHGHVQISRRNSVGRHLPNPPSFCRLHAPTGPFPSIGVALDLIDAPLLPSHAPRIRRAHHRLALCLQVGAVVGIREGGRGRREEWCSGCEKVVVDAVTVGIEGNGG